MSRFFKKASALSLVEVIIAVLILSIFVAGMFGAFEFAKKVGNRYKCKSFATGASRELMEGLLTVDPNSSAFDIGDHGDTDGPINLPPGHFLREYHSGRRKYNVSWHDDPSTTETEDYKILKVTVEWNPPVHIY